MSCITPAPISTESLRRSLLLVTRRLFSDPANYGAERSRLSKTAYHEQEKERTLLVDVLDNLDPSAPHSLPAIYVGIGDINLQQQTVIGNSAGFNEDNSGQIFVRRADGLVQWSHLARHVDVAEELAGVTLDFFSAMSPWFKENLDLSTFDVTTKSMPRLLNKGSDASMYYVVDVRAAIGYNHTVTLFTESHRLKKIVAEIGVYADLTSVG